MTNTFRNFVFLFIALSASLFICAGGVLAYEATGSKAITLSDGGAIFFIDYSFGHGSRDIYMPVKAANSLSGQSTDALAFSIVDADGQIAKGKASGMVFSKARLSDEGMYKTNKGVKYPFTLMVVFTPDSSDTSLSYRLQVNHLPFSFGGKQQLQLNPSELAKYTTDFLKIR